MLGIMYVYFCPFIGNNVFEGERGLKNCMMLFIVVALPKLALGRGGGWGWGVCIVYANSSS